MASANSTIPLPKNDPLDSLHSPDVTYFAAEDREVETITSATDSEFNDIALDDEAVFSAHQELSSHDLDSPDTARPPIVSTTPQEADPQPTKTGHKKSASTTTIRSDNNLPFIISRLQDEHRLSQRGSVDGQHKLQEEFARLHKEEEKATEPATNKTIDWDFWGAVISDYQGFAAERPEELASAIARGIPDTLRGMMWQHMAASKDPELEDVYLKLLKEVSTHEKSITRDLGRTFPHHDFFNDGQGIGQENLFNVLKAYSL
ncbi:GTPase-activating protein GYP5 [Termitomyces sp. T112]|nr:GTPase-activating protein GYP5 [Termitomyces sp. T112]